MRAPLVVVTGTGTGIGKTQLAAALLGAWRDALVEAGHAHAAVAGLKPIETGGTAAGGEDASTLEQLSTFHVKRFPPPYLLARPVSPHLAARDEGRAVELATVVRYVEAVRAEADGVVVELAGGLFTPLGPGLSNADVVRALDADRVLLAAPDRLGVLHDVAAASRAASASDVALAGIVLVAPAVADASTGTNAAELAVVTALPLLARLPWAPVAELARHEDVRALVRGLVRAPASSRAPRP